MTAIAVVLLLGFVVLGPTKLAEFAGKAGALYARLKRAQAELLAEISPAGPREPQPGCATEPISTSGVPVAGENETSLNETSLKVANTIAQLCEQEFADVDPPEQTAA